LRSDIGQQYAIEKENWDRKLDSLSLEKQRLEQEIKELRNQISHLQAENKEYSRNSISQRNAISELETALQSEKKAVIQKNTEIESLQKANQSLQSKITVFENTKVAVACPNCQKAHSVPLFKHIKFTCTHCETICESENGHIVRFEVPKPKDTDTFQIKGVTYAAPHKASKKPTFDPFYQTDTRN
jgi:DNA gyrase/topoisomerase IV subunit A